MPKEAGRRPAFRLIGTELAGGMDEVLAAEAEALAGEEDAALCSLNFLRQDILNLMLETAGVSLIALEGRLFVDDDGFRQAAETVGLFYRNLDQNSGGERAVSERFCRGCHSEPCFWGAPSGVYGAVFLRGNGV